MRVALDSVRVDRNDDAVTDLGDGAERISECKRPAGKKQCDRCAEAPFGG
jgi:hypothetical protein